MVCALRTIVIFWFLSPSMRNAIQGSRESSNQAKPQTLAEEGLDVMDPSATGTGGRHGQGFLWISAGQQVLLKPSHEAWLGPRLGGG